MFRLHDEYEEVIGEIKMPRVKKLLLLIFLNTFPLAAMDQPKSSPTTELLHALFQMNSKLDYDYLIRVPSLLASGANPNLRDQNGNTLLLILSQFDKTNIIAKILLKYPVDPNITDPAGNSPLLWAVKNKNTELAKLLIEKNANPNETNALGISPLMIAVSNNDIEIIKLLLNAGAEPYIKDSNGQTALDIAREKNLTGIIDLLSKKKLV